MIPATNADYWCSIIRKTKIYLERQIGKGLDQNVEHPIINKCLCAPLKRLVQVHTFLSTHKNKKLIYLHFHFFFYFTFYHEISLQFKDIINSDLKH